MFHVCEEGRRQSSFLCPRGTIFNQVTIFSFRGIVETEKYHCDISAQEFRVCDWWDNVKCENSAEYFDRNLDLMIQVPTQLAREKGVMLYSCHIPGPAKELTRLFIISNCSCPWPRSLQLSWGWPKLGALFLQGLDLIVTRSSSDRLCVTFAGWLWLARFRTRPFRHIRNIQFTFLIAFKTISLFIPL